MSREVQETASPGQGRGFSLLIECAKAVSPGIRQADDPCQNAGLFIIGEGHRVAVGLNRHGLEVHRGVEVEADLFAGVMGPGQAV